MIKKLYLILILCLFVFSCGSNEESINISEEIPTSLIKSPEKKYNVEDFISVGWKKNKKLDNRILEIKNVLSKGLPTIPTTIEDELDCNIFLRSGDLETFSKLRDLKDNF